MKRLSDEEIQKLLEGGNSFPDPEAPAAYRMYQHIFDSLKTEPDYSLPADFSAQVTNIVQQQVMHRRNVRYYLWITGVSLLSLVLGLLALVFVNLPLVMNLFGFVSAYRWIIIAVIIFFSGIQAGDRLLRKHIMYPAGLVP